MKSKSKTLNMIQAALMGAVICVCSMLNFNIGPIPFSMSVFGIILTSLLLSPSLSLGSVAVYAAAGIIGLPVFSGGQAGPQVFAGPTGGYIIGYFILALVLSLAVKKNDSPALALLGGSAGLFGCYALGTAWFVAVSKSTWQSALALCVLPFIIPDLIKLAAAAGIARAIKKALGKRRVT